MEVSSGDTLESTRVISGAAREAEGAENTGPSAKPFRPQSGGGPGVTALVGSPAECFFQPIIVLHFEKKLSLCCYSVQSFKSMLPIQYKLLQVFKNVRRKAASRHHAAAAHTAVVVVVGRVQFPQLVLSDLSNQCVEGVLHSLSCLG